MKKSLIFPLILLALATSSLAQSPPEESIQSIIKLMVEGLIRIEPIAADVVRTQHRQLQDRKAQLTAQQYQQGEEDVCTMALALVQVHQAIYNAEERLGGDLVALDELGTFKNNLIKRELEFLDTGRGLSSTLPDRVFVYRITRQINGL